MLLKRLSLINFKNYDKTALDFDATVVCFTGENGAGKTNLFDAIHYLCVGRSYFNIVDIQNIRYDQDFFRLEGTFEKDNRKEKVVCTVERGKKKRLSINEVEHERISDHIGSFPVVVIAPDDLVLINGGSEERRKFIDYILSTSDREYLQALLVYNRLLSQRNALLKQFREKHLFDRPMLQSYDEQMIPLAEEIFLKRKHFIEAFLPVFNKNYEEISGGKEVVSIEYCSDLLDNKYGKLLKDNVEKDRVLERTTTGIHKDDLKFRLNDHQVKKYGSQGQKKTFLVALKLAQYTFLENKMEVKPLLLLDDLYDKLDPLRAAELLKMSSCGKFGQVFITDTQEERLASFFKEHQIDFDLFRIQNGKIADNYAEKK